MSILLLDQWRKSDGVDTSGKSTQVIYFMVLEINLFSLSENFSCVLTRAEIFVVVSHDAYRSECVNRPYVQEGTSNWLVRWAH